MIKHITIWAFIAFLLPAARAQLIRVGSSSGSTFTMAAGGNTVAWKDGNNLSVSFNRQQALVYTIASGFNMLYASDKLAGYKTSPAAGKLFLSNGGEFTQVIVDTTSVNYQVALENDEALWNESKVFVSKLYYSKNLGTPELLTSSLKQLDFSRTSLEYLFLQSNGYTYWKQGGLSQLPDTLMCRKPDGTVSMIASEPLNVRGCEALGNNFLYITGESTPSLQYSVNAGAPVKLLDLKNNTFRVSFLGTEHFALQTDSGVSVFKLKPSVEHIKTLSGLAFFQTVNSGIVLSAGCPGRTQCNFYLLTGQADTIRVNAQEASDIERYSVYGENLCFSTRASATTLPASVKWYKSGIAQPDIVRASSGFSVSRVQTTNTMLVIEQSNFMKPDSTGIYVFGFGNLPSALNEQSSSGIHADVYPNPATEQLTISLPENYTLLYAQIYDLAGHLIIQQHTSTLHLDSLAPGMYLLAVKTDRGDTVKRFIKQ
jgi:hypothetical protein